MRSNGPLTLTDGFPAISIVTDGPSAAAPARSNHDGLSATGEPEAGSTRLGPNLRVDGPHAATPSPALLRLQEKTRKQAEALARKQAAAEAKLLAKMEAKARAQERALAAASRSEAAGAGTAASVIRGRIRQWRGALPAWSSSALAHAGLLLCLLTVTIKIERKPPDLILTSAGIDTTIADEPVKVLTSNLMKASESLVDSNVAESASSSAPSVSVTSPVANESAGSVQQSMEGPTIGSPLGALPASIAMDVGNGGGVAGDVTYGVGDHGEAIDQLAREILRHLNQHKVTVAWLFDESESMKDDQQAVKTRFEKIEADIRSRLDDQRQKSEALLHAVIGFGRDLHFEQDPTADHRLIVNAIDRLKIDKSGAESTFEAFGRVITRYRDHTEKDRRLLIVLVTDESGDDGAGVEPIRELCIRKRVPVYVIGRQSLFGKSEAAITYVDPETKFIYYPTIRRGPETADFEAFQYDGLHGRDVEEPSGFAPYELARLAKETGGIYFLLPTEEGMRCQPREKKFSMLTLKEYVPDYESRAEYVAKRNASELRRTMHKYIEMSKSMGLDHRFPTNSVAEFEKEALASRQEAIARLAILKEMNRTLEGLESQRDREPEKRWQAAYDLMRAQVSTYQVKTFEFQKCVEYLLSQRPAPAKPSSSTMIVEWEVNHSAKRFAPEEITAKKYAEATALLNKVIERHPNTPWADLAQDELDRGLGVEYREFTYDSRYYERSRLVPKY